MSEGKSVVIVGACRTPIGSFCGAFKNTPGHDLGAIVIGEALKRAGVAPDQVSQVIMGQSLTAGQGQNPARRAALKAGVPASAPAFGVNMLCGSGLQAVRLAWQSVMMDEATIAVAGGQENMSMANHCAALRSGVKYGTGAFQDTILTDGLTDAFLNMHMGETAEALALKYDIPRQAQDEQALESQARADRAIAEGNFQREITPVTVKVGRTEVVVTEDEYPKRDTTLAALQKLKPAFGKDERATVTAGNASGINDGAAAVVLCGSDVCAAMQLTPLARIVAFAQTGIEPVDMGLGPVSAVRKLLKKCGWSTDDVDLFEINEAFAVQLHLCVEQLNLPGDRVNISGGAIALGHPIGASGARVLVTLLHNMLRLGKGRGVAALCVGGGMGIAIAVERDR